MKKAVQIFIVAFLVIGLTWLKHKKNIQMADFINSLIFLVYAYMAYIMRLTFIDSQKQTKLSLSINQFNIQYAEFKGFLEEARTLRFKSDLTVEEFESIKGRYDKSDGVHYIDLFTMVVFINTYRTMESDEQRIITNKKIDDFRYNVLFPLERYYDKLLDYLTTIKADKLLDDTHKLIIYKSVERDLLQSYFRICNNNVNGHIEYDLSIFKTQAYDSTMFYRINEFYISNKVFSYKSLDFYIKTL